MKAKTLFRLIVAGSILLMVMTDLSAQMNYKDLVHHSVLTYGDEGEWDDGYVWSPAIIKDGDTLRMWYRGSQGNLQNTTTGHIGYAWSLDGNEWNKYPENPVLSATLDWEGDIVENPIVIKDGDTLKMWYDSNKQGYAESLDGINWTKHPEPLTLTEGPQSEWDDGLLWISTIIKEDNEYKMWYSGGRPGFPWDISYPQVGLATSPDGIDWTKYDDPATQNAPYAFSDPVLKVGEENDWDYLRAYFPKVIKTDTGYTMFYTGIKGPVSSEVMQQTGLAYSTDGINWTKGEQNPIIKDDHSVVEWGRGIISGALLYYNDRFHYWFCCEFTPPYSFRPQIGYAVQLTPCPPGSFEFTAQVEVDSFKANYNHCNKIDGAVKIYGDDITNLSGLNNLTSIGSILEIGSYYGGCPLLTNLSGLENLNSVRAIDIMDNASLLDITGLKNIHSIKKQVSIVNNDSLKNLSGLEGVETIGGRVSIIGNDALVSLHGLDNLDSILGNLWGGGELIIQINNALINLNGLESLTFLAEGIEDYESRVSIDSNESLVSLEGIEKLGKEDVQLLFIKNNPSLSVCDDEWVCNILSDTTTGIFIENNAPGCNNTEEVVEDCNNNCLTSGFSPYLQEDIDNFPSNYEGCSEIEGNLSISSGHITNLDSLMFIKTIGGSLSISGCSNLVSIAGLDNLTSIGSNLSISYNSNLSICNVVGICSYLDSPNGEVNIHDNAPGCNSQEEVQDSCLVSIEEYGVITGLKIHPNPFNQIAIIEYELQLPSTVKITIYNHLGWQVDFIQQSQSQGKQQISWDASGQPSGMYYFRMQAREQTATGKVVLVR